MCPVSGLFCFDQNLLLRLQTKEKGRNSLLSLHHGQLLSPALPISRPLSLACLPVLSGSSFLSWGFLQIPDARKEMKSAVEYVLRRRWTPGANLERVQASSAFLSSPGPALVPGLTEPPTGSSRNCFSVGDQPPGGALGSFYLFLLFFYFIF